MYTYHGWHQPWSVNVAAAALFSICGAVGHPSDLTRLHESVGYLDITRFGALQTYLLEWKSVVHMPKALLKLQFYQPPQSLLSKIAQAWVCVSIDFKRPVTTSYWRNNYLLIVVVECNWLPSEFAYKVHKRHPWLTALFSLKGSPLDFRKMKIRHGMVLF